MIRIKDDYRKTSANSNEKREINELIIEIDTKEEFIETLSEEIRNLEDDRVIKRHDSNELQLKLIREGDLMSIDELNRLNNQKSNLKPN